MFQARLLANQLTRIQLPGLTSIEQLELLALSDTFASTKLDLEKSPADIERGLNFAKREGKGTGYIVISMEMMEMIIMKMLLLLLLLLLMMMMMMMMTLIMVIVMVVRDWS